MIDIEIIIPTKDRPEDLKNALESILVQTVLPLKVVIVDSGVNSIDINSYINKFEELKVKFIHIKSKSGLTYQRNVGLMQLSSDLVLFLDDDVVLEKDYLKEIITVFVSDSIGEIGGVTGRITNNIFKPNVLSKALRSLFFLPKVSKGEILPSGFANAIDPLIEERTTVNWLSGCNMAYRKDAIEWNWFDENLKSYSYSEDLDFSYRIGKNKKLIYEPKAKLEHRISPNGRLSQKEKSSMLMRNHAYLFKKNIPQTAFNRFAFFLSLKGLMIQSLFFQRSIGAFIGSFSTFFEIVLMHNYKRPFYLERLDFHRPYKNQIAEHYYRYNFIANFCKDKDVLDCASGDGIGINILKDVANSVTGVDIDIDTVNRASKNVSVKNVKIIQGSALCLPFEDASFDIVTSIETIEHIPFKYHAIMLKEFHRVLKPGGKLIMSTPNKDRTSPNRIAPNNYFHIAELSFQEFKDKLALEFSEVTMYGLFNHLREGSIEEIKEIYKVGMVETNFNSINKLSLKKKIMLIAPFWFKDCLSLILKGRHNYPAINEFEYKIENAEIAINSLGICQK